MAEIDAFFKLMHEQGASDLHLSSGQQPALRIFGEIERIKYDVLTNDKLRSLLSLLFCRRHGFSGPVDGQAVQFPAGLSHCHGLGVPGGIGLFDKRPSGRASIF